MASTALLGSTGMVGSQILSHMISSPRISSIDVLARRHPIPDSSAPPKLTAFTDADTSKWATHYKSLSPAPSIIFSALATTRAAAGGFDNQYKLDHGLNVEIAKAAREAGSKVYVLISASTANPKAIAAYSKMKGQIEEDIKALDFETTIILRPGVISGHRDESRPAEAVLRKIAGGLGMINAHYLKDGWAQESDMIAKAAVIAGLQALDGHAPEKVWILNGREIMSTARTQ